MAGFDESLLHPDWRPRSSTSADDTIFNAAPVISSDSRVSLQDRQSGLPGQRAESQGSADFDVADEINNASASAFARDNTLHGGSCSNASNSAAPKQQMLLRPGPHERMFTHTSSDSSLMMEGNMRKWSNSPAVTVDTTVSVNVQFEFSDHELGVLEYIQERYRLVRKKVRERAMEALQRYVDEETEGKNL